MFTYLAATMAIASSNEYYLRQMREEEQRRYKKRLQYMRESELREELVELKEELLNTQLKLDEANKKLEKIENDKSVYNKLSNILTDELSNLSNYD